MKTTRSKLLASLFLPFVSFASVLAQHSGSVSSIDDPTCELIRPNVYRIDFHASPDAGAIDIFASSRPDRIDSAKPLITTSRESVEVAVGTDRPDRVYFHLKPASGSTRVVSVRRLPLEGAVNFRDLGGYRTSDGRHVRWGLIYRSGDLSNLRAADYRYLESLGVRLVCDLRTDGDRKRSPTRWMGRMPETLVAPIGHERQFGPAADKAKLAGNTPISSASSYDEYATAYAEQYGAVLRRLAAGDLPAVEHCSSGKDRSGLFSAILLTALGVSRETVVQDYLLTTKYTLDSESFERTTSDLQRILGLSQRPDAVYVRAKMTTRAATLESTFDIIDKTYGSFDVYLRKGLNLSDADLAALRQRLLEP
jgi:protein-tyrosine phosphatase